MKLQKTLVTLCLGLGVLFSQHAVAGFISVEAAFTGIVDVRTTGTASVAFVGGPGSDVHEALAFATDGMLDPLGDEMFFTSETSTTAEGAAFNAGFGEFISSTSIAEATSGSSAGAFTGVETTLQLSGTGTVEIDLGFSLFAEGLGNGEGAGLFAGVFAATTFTDTVSAVLDTLDVTGVGSSIVETGILTLVLNVDDLGFGPYTEALTVVTEAGASAVAAMLDIDMGGGGSGNGGGSGGSGEGVSVPEPSVWLLLLLGLAGLQRIRRVE